MSDDTSTYHGTAQHCDGIPELEARVRELEAENERLRAACAAGWGEPMLVNELKAERDALRALLREAQEELTTWMYHGHGSKTSGFGSATLCNRIDAALAGEKL